MSQIPSKMFVGHYDPLCHNVWDPFQEFDTMVPIPHHAFPSEATSFMNSPLFWKEMPDGLFVLKADLPGFRKEEVMVELEEGRVLRIRGEKRLEREENRDNCHRVARCSGKFIRKLRLPENAMADRIEVFMGNGVLTVTVPKENMNHYSPHVRVIQISGN